MIAVLLLALFQAAQPSAKQQFDRLAVRAGEARKAGRDTDALRLYQQALRLKPTWADGWWNAASISYQRDDLPAARDALRKLVALDNNAIAGYALLGICEYKLRNYDAAFEHLDKAHALGIPHDHPLGSSALYFLALLL